jgi:hypothetical protein
VPPHGIGCVSQNWGGGDWAGGGGASNLSNITLLLDACFALQDIRPIIDLVRLLGVFTQTARSTYKFWNHPVNFTFWVGGG